MDYIHLRGSLKCVYTLNPSQFRLEFIVHTVKKLRLYRPDQKSRVYENRKYGAVLCLVTEIVIRECRYYSLV